jgi:ParB family chromosome partitioning protein
VAEVPTHQKGEIMTELPINDIIVGVRSRQDLGDIAGLANDIRNVGLRHAIVITPDKRLVWGARRLAAVRELGWATVPVRVVDNLDDALRLVKAERDESTTPKNLTPSEAAAQGRKLEALLKAKAKERQQATQTKPGEGTVGGGNSPLPEDAGPKRKTRDKVAEAVGMSGRRYAEAKAVVLAAEEDPDLRPVVEEMDRTGEVDPAYRKVQEKKRPTNTARRREEPDNRPEEAGPLPAAVKKRVLAALTEARDTLSRWITEIETWHVTEPTA